jgi:hypothetical protein
MVRFTLKKLSLLLLAFVSLALCSATPRLTAQEAEPKEAGGEQAGNSEQESRRELQRELARP